MRNRIIVITTLVLMLIAGVFCWNNVSRYTFKEETKIQDTKEKLKNVENKEVIETTEEQRTKPDLQDDKVDEKIESTEKDTEKVEAITPSKEVKEVKQSNPNPKQEVKQEESNGNVAIVEPKKQEIWESLGMTKDQYYNQPMYSWERVDFKSREECVTHGDKYEPYVNGEVLYNCRDVTSPSGKYLGAMFDLEKLN